MSQYPRKFAFVKTETSIVVSMQVAFTPEVSFTPNPGYESVEIAMDSPVAVGWLYLLDTDTNTRKFQPGEAP